MCCITAVLWCDVVDWCGYCRPRPWLWWWPPAAAARLGPPAAPAPGPPARPARPASQSRAVSSSRRSRTAVTRAEQCRVLWPGGGGQQVAAALPRCSAARPAATLSHRRPLGPVTSDPAGPLTPPGQYTTSPGRSRNQKPTGQRGTNTVLQ